MSPLRQSLRAKVLVVFVVPTLVLVVVYGGLAYFAGVRGLEDELGARLVAIGQAISAEMSEDFEAKQIARLDADKTRTLDNLRERLEATRERTGVRRIYLFDRERNSLIDTRPDVRFGDRLYALEADQLELDRTFSQAEPTRSVLFTAEDGTRFKTGYAPITLDGETIAVVGVEGSAEYFDVLTEFATALVVVGLFGLLLVIAAGSVFARRLTRPVNRLVDEARRLGRGEWDEPIAPRDADPDGDEIAFLAHTFDEMRRDIRGRDRQMQMMLSGIAHEVRNPLGGMELFCGLLEEDIRDLSDDPDRLQKLEKVARIKRELAYLERVVTDFLDYARQVPLDVERFDAATLADELRELLAGEVIDAGSSLEFELAPDVELTVDRTRIRRALINVIRNAYQACDEGSTIVVEVAEADDERVIRVRDDGPGIPAESLDDILTPFFTTKEKGSGLGLALTRNIVEEHGGRMEVDSEVGVGTTVSFWLPFHSEIERSEPEIPEGWLG
jgi:signal transduction histidine kinase